MIYFGIWLLFGVLSAMVASGKGRNPVGWFFLGILFGPLAFLFVLISGKLPVAGTVPTPATFYHPAPHPHKHSWPNKVNMPNHTNDHDVFGTDE